jgi:anti-sigma B factor antagonist
MRLTVRTRETGPGTITLSLQGPLDGQTSGLLDQTIERTLDGPVKVLVLDMQGVDFITSAGIGTIMKAKTSLKKRKAELALVNLQLQVQKVFEIIRVLPTLGVFQDRAELDEYLGAIQRRATDEEG